ncbi:MAG: lytic transglycosylase domain-containing protein [Deltaproteobacteria bacterium]|nr:lytic transglycosylase domain-containing protein [Deltaproteobacteria bacterium]
MGSDKVVSEAGRESGMTRRATSGDGRFLPFWARAGLALAVGALAVASTPHAVADEVAGLLRARSRVGAWAPRDPGEFAAGLEVVLPRPVVVLNRQDAVAAELLQHARTLGERDGLRVAQALCDEATRLGFDPLLFLAIIHVESYYDHLAISPRGAEGLMQIMPETALWTAAETNLDWPDSHSFDPVLNVRLGARYFDHLRHEFPRLEVALTAYNRGPKATRYILRQHGRLPSDVVDFYAAKITERYRRLTAQYGALPAI